MPRETRSTRDHYAEITNQIVEALEAGVPPWRKPWDSAKAGGPAMPQNAVTGARYRGINLLTLGVSPLALTTSDPRWATYKQAQERKWQVRKGARGVTGFFYKRIEVDRGEEPGGKGGTWFPLLRSFTLFHASEIDGIPDYTPPGAEEAPWRASDATETILRESGAVIRIGGDRAFYSTLTDHIQMPPQHAFRSAAALASVQMHELAHWSGAEHRLKRDLSGRFGSELYSQEELRAELAQIFICAELGIKDCDFTNGAAYIADWIRKLRDDKREIFRAAADAQRIAGYILAFHPDYAAQRSTSSTEAPTANEDQDPPPLREAA
ncbi:ArdC family protein [Acidisoma sp. 7E03]